jgi:hypothetical protein
MKFREIREICWPLLDPLEEKEASKISIEDISLTDKDLETCYDMALKYYEEEEDRKSSVESKSTIFVSAIGFTTVILLSVTKDLVLSTSVDFSSATCVYLAFLVLIVIFMVRAVWFAIMALERRGYHSLNYKDIINKDSDTEYTKALIIKLINCTLINHATVNLKVDYMVMAHEYFKRAIATIAMYSITLAIAFPFTRYIKIGSNDDKIIKILSSTNFGTWLLSACLIAFCVNIYYLKKQLK